MRQQARGGQLPGFFRQPGLLLLLVAPSRVRRIVRVDACLCRHRERRGPVHAEGYHGGGGGAMVGRGQVQAARSTSMALRNRAADSRCR